jgi:hypothetical protein
VNSAPILISPPPMRLRRIACPRLRRQCGCKRCYFIAPVYRGLRGDTECANRHALERLASHRKRLNVIGCYRCWQRIGTVGSSTSFPVVPHVESVLASRTAPIRRAGLFNSLRPKDSLTNTALAQPSCFDTIQNSQHIVVGRFDSTVVADLQLESESRPSPRASLGPFAPISHTIRF